MGQPGHDDSNHEGGSRPFLDGGGQRIYLSPQGDDRGDGTAAAPVATLEKAVSLAAERRKELGAEETIDILLRGGVYRPEDTVLLKGITPGGAAPLRISAYGGETVRLTGGVDIPLSAMTAASSQFTGRIIDRAAAPHVLQYDLKQSGISDYGELSRRGYLISANETAQAELSLNGKTQRLAAWPNEDYRGFTEIVDGGKRRLDPSGQTADITDGCSFKVDFDRPSYWNDQKNVWVSGVLGPNYFNDSYPMERFDAGTRTLYLREGAVSDYPHTKEFFRFENIPEELDAPGEYYIDRSGGMLYFYPPEDAGDGSVLTVTMNRNDLVRIEDCGGITFENLIFDGGRASAITGRNTDNITVKNCRISSFGGNGIKLDDTTNARVEGCAISDVGKNGVMLTGGDYQNLISSGNVVYNNDISRFARLERCYHAGVYIGYQSVGTRVRRNHIHDAPHAGIIFYGADHEITGNEVDNVVKECHDMNAVYANISCYPWERGNVIRRNYFHSLGQERFLGERQVNVSAIRSDNNGCGLTVTENLFYHIGTQKSNSVCGVNAEGTRNRVNRNLFVDCSGTYKGNGGAYDPASAYTDDSVINGVKVSELKTQLNRYLPVYGQRFPELYTFFDEYPRAVRTNEFCGNMVINLTVPLSDVDKDRNASTTCRGTAELVLAENNYVGKSDPGFADYKNGDLSLTDSALALIDGFPNLKMSDFGLVGG